MEKLILFSAFAAWGISETTRICCIRKGRQANPCMFHSKLLKQLQSINRRTI
ncbi:hypothetical protein MtrunA17_Chr3g0140921 [Medicago truncatula]|uniref:Uncharacterized protein n=1 Tax=Medicago truncatula TaxID=3880 RepID=A0A396J243_MEDTR|nr:hypothetical protein MtrunA17_Chr3g0140921 [Medicago truncatula]